MELKTTNSQLVDDIDLGQCERTEVNGKSLLIPPEIQAKTRELEAFIYEKGTKSVEVGGCGLVVELEQDTYLLVDFIPPDFEKAFYFESKLFIGRSEAQFVNIFQAENLEIVLNDEKIVITNDAFEESESLVFPVNQGQIQWDAKIKRFLEEIWRIQLPDRVEDFKGLVPGLPFLKEQSSEADTTTYRVTNDLELIATAGTVMKTERYLNKVREKAAELDADVDYDLHFHPPLSISAEKANLEDADTQQREDWYRNKLYFSAGDLEQMTKDEGTKLFEIRAVGTPEYPLEQGRYSNRIYNTEHILAVSAPLRKALEDLLANERMSDDELIRICSVIESAVADIRGSDYPTRVLVEYYIGQERFRDIQSRYDDADLVFNRDFVIYSLTRLRNNSLFPSFSADLFAARDELTFLTFSLEYLWEGAGSFRDRIGAISSDFGLDGGVKGWMQLETDPDRIRSLSAQIRSQFEEELRQLEESE